MKITSDSTEINKKVYAFKRKEEIFKDKNKGI